MTFPSLKKLIPSLAIACLGIIPTALSQQKSMTPEDVEVAKQQFNQAIEQSVLKILENVELLEEQVEPMQKALISYLVPVQIQRMKMQAKRQQAGQGNGERPTRGEREAMMAQMNQLQKLRTDVDKTVKAIIDKKQFKKYKAAMDALMPQRRGPGAGGRRGGR